MRVPSSTGEAGAGVAESLRCIGILGGGVKGGAEYSERDGGAM